MHRPIQFVSSLDYINFYEIKWPHSKYGIVITWLYTLLKDIVSELSCAVIFLYKLQKLFIQ